MAPHHILKRITPSDRTAGISIFKRFSSSQSSSLPWHVWIPMPQLSPSMNSGKIVHWKVKEGERVEITDLIARLEVDNLLENPIEDSDHKHKMEYESHEEGTIARIVAHEGESRSPGEPIALLVEREEDISALAHLDPPTDVSDSLFVWQVAPNLVLSFLLLSSSLSSFP
ncbi:hypothetical protein AAMO2058_001745700 [Amorphochlora amoebiformis]